MQTVILMGRAAATLDANVIIKYSGSHSGEGTLEGSKPDASILTFPIPRPVPSYKSATSSPGSIVLALQF